MQAFPSISARPATDGARRQRRLFRLPNPVDALMGSRLIDGPATHLVARLLFPLSRLWAATEVAGGDPDRFADAVPLTACPRGLRRHLGRVLPKIDRARQRSHAAEAAWEAGFFGVGKKTEEALKALEAERVSAARALALQRLRLLWTLMRARVPRARFAVAAADQVSASLGDWLDDPARAFALPNALPPVTRSRQMPGREGRDYWLRFEAPSRRLSGTVWARVREPDAVNPPTFIFVGGVAAEFDQIDLPPKKMLALVRRGIRVIEVEAPFHGRRRRPGEYSGEPYFAEVPLGAMDLLTGMAQELGVIASWVRSAGTSRICFAGVSMGALVSQLAGCHAHLWPQDCRPDSLFLIATVDEVHRLPFDSRLAQLIDMPGAIADAGLGPMDAARWCGLTDATRPSMAPENIVAVLGRRDRITPFAAGHAQMLRWRVPPENLFIREGGHFSTPFGMLNDGRALDRVATMLGR